MATVTADEAMTPEFSPDEAVWHALYTRHQHEKMTARMLAYKGIEVFLPLYSTAHRWKDRTKKLSLPLFPCYLFFRGGLDRQLEIVSTPGVYSLVGAGGQVAVIPDSEMQAIRRIVSSSLPAEPHQYLKSGDLVRVRFGPLAGIEGIFVRQKDQFKLIVSVKLLRRSVAVEMDAAAVEPAARRMPIGSPVYA
jgi:transcription antitermination factor NusG